MFQIIDYKGEIRTAYGAFVDANKDVQFILCNAYGEFQPTNVSSGTYILYDPQSKVQMEAIKRRNQDAANIPNWKRDLWLKLNPLREYIEEIFEEIEAGEEYDDK